MTIKQARSALLSSARAVAHDVRGGNHMYVHIWATQDLDLSGRAALGHLEHLVGEATDVIPWNVLKLSQDKVSFLYYPCFSKEAAPALYQSLTVSMKTGRTTLRTYSSNPPVFHQKHLLVPEGHPKKAAWVKLDSDISRAGLLKSTALVSRADGWSALLRERGLDIVDDELVRKS